MQSQILLTDALLACHGRQGDVALVDNVVAMHGRRPFEGKRRVLASLADVCRLSVA